MQTTHVEWCGRVHRLKVPRTLGDSDRGTTMCNIRVPQADGCGYYENFPETRQAFCKNCRRIIASLPRLILTAKRFIDI